MGKGRNEMLDTARLKFALNSSESASFEDPGVALVFQHSWYPVPASAGTRNVAVPSSAPSFSPTAHEVELASCEIPAR